MSETARGWKAINSHASQFSGLFNCEHFLRGHKTPFVKSQKKVPLFMLCVYICVCVYIRENVFCSPLK